MRQLLKDLEMVNEFAGGIKAPTPMMGEALSLYRMLAHLGHTELDGARSQALRTVGSAVTAITEGTVLWQPPPERAQASELARYMRWLADTRGLRFDDYQALHRWSVDRLEDFWATLWEFLGVRASVPYARVLDAHGDARREVVRRGATQLRRARVPARRAGPAGDPRALGGPRRVGGVLGRARAPGRRGRRSLREMGVRPGDRVASYLPNIPETVVAFLAVTSLGAIWSSCSPDMGTGAVVDRFRQIEPKVLFAVDGYRYGGKPYDRRAVVGEIVGALPTLERVVFLPYLDAGRATRRVPQAVPWSSVVAREAKLAFEQVPFDHPLWIVYSSGTTGVPKAIVHGHGGIVIEHLKTLRLHKDMRPGDRFFWVSSTGWIVWTLLVSGLLGGCTIVMFDGNPAYPDAARSGGSSARRGRITSAAAPRCRRRDEGGRRAGENRGSVAAPRDQHNRVAADGGRVRVGLCERQARPVARLDQRGNRHRLRFRRRLPLRRSPPARSSAAASGSRSRRSTRPGGRSSARSASWS